MAKRTKSEAIQDASRRVRLGELIRAAREGAGSTLNDVRGKMKKKMSVPYLSDVERGNRNISPSNLRGLVEVLGLDETQAQAIFKEAGCLPPEVQKRVLEAPEIWALDPKSAHHALVCALNALTGKWSKPDAILALKDALKPKKW